MTFTAADGRDHRAARARAVGQEHGAADDRRPGAARRRPRSAWATRSSRVKSVAGAPGRVRVPALRPVPAHDRGRQRGVRPRACARSRRQTSASASTSCWSWCSSRRSPSATRISSRAASASGWRWRARSRRSRRCCCSTSRSARSTRGSARTSAAGSTSCTASSGVTSLLVTHDQEEALELANQIVVMHEGKVEQVGSPERDLRPSPPRRSWPGSSARPERPARVRFGGSRALRPFGRLPAPITWTTGSRRTRTCGRHDVRLTNQAGDLVPGDDRSPHQCWLDVEARAAAAGRPVLVRRSRTRTWTEISSRGPSSSTYAMPRCSRPPGRRLCPTRWRRSEAADDVIQGSRGTVTGLPHSHCAKARTTPWRAVTELAAVSDGAGLVKGERIGPGAGDPAQVPGGESSDQSSVERPNRPRSHRGQEGGFQLARLAGEITVAEVIRAVEGPVDEGPGFPSGGDSYEGLPAPSATCSLAVQGVLDDLLEGITAPDVASARSRRPCDRSCSPGAPPGSRRKGVLASPA